MQFVLTTFEQPSKYYVGMIHGMVCHVDQDLNKAKVFGSISEAKIEKEKHIRHLGGFKVEAVPSHLEIKMRYK